MVTPLPRGNSGDRVYVQAPRAPVPDYSEVKQLGQDIEQVGTKIAVNEATQAGSEAVSRDPATGELTYHAKFELFPWDAAYNQSARDAYQAQSDIEQRQQLQQIFQDNADAPQKGQALGQSWLKGYVDKAPPDARAWIRAHGGQLIGQLTMGATAKKFEVDTTNHYNDLLRDYHTVEDEWINLASQNGVHTPEGLSLHARMTTLGEQMKNPNFKALGVTDAKIDALLSDSEAMAMAEAGVSHVLSVAKAEGEDAGYKAADEIFVDPALKLSPAQRYTYKNRAQESIREWRAQGAEARHEAQMLVALSINDAKVDALANGKVDPAFIKQIETAFPGIQGQQQIREIQALAREHSMGEVVKLATPAELVALQKKMDPRTPATGRLTGDDVEASVLKLVPGSRITSRGRTDEENAAAGGVENSAHLIRLGARALDFVPPTGVTLEQAAAKVRVDNPGLEVIVEGPGAKHSTAPHVHIEWPEGAGGGGLAERAGDSLALQKAITARNKALKDDSPSYVLSNKPDIAARMQAALNVGNLKAYQDEVFKMLDVQRRLGVAPLVLGKPAATQIAQEFANPPDPAKRADYMTGKIQTLKLKYGKYFDKVMGELTAAGMPSEAVALAQPNDPLVQQRLSNAINTGRSVLRALVIDKASDIDKEMPKAIDDYSRSMVGRQDGGAVISQQLQSTQLYAYQLAAEGNTNAAEIASKAASDLVTGRYNFDQTYRVPKNIDFNKVQSGANYVRRRLLPQNLFAEQTSDKTVPEAERRDYAARILSEKGVWGTLPDESGLVLLWPADMGYAPAHDASGKAIRFTWDQLKAAGGPASLPMSGTAFEGAPL